jgi:hypothetical protein
VKITGVKASALQHLYPNASAQQDGSVGSVVVVGSETSVVCSGATIVVVGSGTSVVGCSSSNSGNSNGGSS